MILVTSCTCTTVPMQSSELLHQHYLEEIYHVYVQDMIFVLLQVSYMCMFKCPIQKKRRYSQLINKFPAGCLTNNGIVQHWYMFPSTASFPPKLVLFSLFMFLIMLSQDQSQLSRHVNNEGLWRPRSLIFSTMLILNIISLEQYRFLVLNECI